MHGLFISRATIEACDVTPHSLVTNAPAFSIINTKSTDVIAATKMSHLATLWKSFALEITLTFPTTLPRFALNHFRVVSKTISSFCE